MSEPDERESLKQRLAREKAERVAVQALKNFARKQSDPRGPSFTNPKRQEEAVTRSNSTLPSPEPKPVVRDVERGPEADEAGDDLNLYGVGILDPLEFTSVKHTLCWRNGAFIGKFDYLSEPDAGAGLIEQMYVFSYTEPP